jgi:hypothetical protein
MPAKCRSNQVNLHVSRSIVAWSKERVIIMHELFSEPTAENMRNAIKEFDAWEDNSDPALTLLFAQYPENTNLEHVFLKVVALNACYSTQIRVNGNLTPTVYDVARHIVELGIDAKIGVGHYAHGQEVELPEHGSGRGCHHAPDQACREALDDARADSCADWRYSRSA